MIKDITPQYSYFDDRNSLKKERDTRPILENFINCCNYNAVDSLKEILQKEIEYFKVNPQKIADGYLNYCATGHDEVFKTLLNFAQENNIKAKDETFDCFEYLFYKNRFSRMDTLMENNIWSVPELIQHIYTRAQSETQVKKEVLLKFAVNLEKGLLEDNIQNKSALDKPASKFKI